MTFRLLLTTVCLWVSVASAAGSVDALRATATASREQVSKLRAEQLALRNELSALSARIEALKAKRQSSLLPGGELDSALKHSQDLSGVLSTLAQKLSMSESELTAANTALIDSLSQELSVARASFDRQTDRPARRQLISKMKSLRAEREALRAALPVTKVPSLETLKPSDDPEELLEQAELLRDSEEKLTKELKSVETRLAERKEEQDLDRRVERFMGEESMFDDQDRRLRLQRTNVELTTTVGTKTGSPSSAAFESANSTPPTAGSNPSPPPGGTGSGTSPQNDGVRGTDTAFDSISSLQVTHAADARPQVGGSVGTGVERLGDDVAGLDAQRAKLKQLVEQLDAKAKALEQRAAGLK